jgi:hypothetical protein
MIKHKDAHRTILDPSCPKNSQYQIRSLERQIGDLYARTPSLTDITNKHTLPIVEHTNLIADLALYLNIHTVQNPAVSLQDVYITKRNITRALEVARNTFQAAQFRRLSIDFLRADHLASIFKTIQDKAHEEQVTLIPERAPDSFQLETRNQCSAIIVDIRTHLRSLLPHPPGTRSCPQR